MRLALPVTLLFMLPGGAWAQGLREPPRTLPDRPLSCTVARVIDGDTVQCADGRRIRLRGVDTPERGEQNYREATRALRQRIEGRTVTVVPHHRSYGRVVGDVQYRGRNIGREMHDQCYSRAPEPRPPQRRY